MEIKTTVTMQPSEQSPIVEMDNDLLNLIRSCLEDDKKVLAIRILRYTYELKTKKFIVLKEAKDIVEYIQANPNFRVFFTT